MTLPERAATSLAAALTLAGLVVYFLGFSYLVSGPLFAIGSLVWLLLWVRTWE